MEYLVNILVMIIIYVILAISLDLLVGHTGLLSMTHAGFYGLGAYCSALMTVRLGFGFPSGVFTGIAVAVAISMPISLSSARLQKDYFVIATFGFQMIVAGVFSNWMSLTNGPLGISGIPQPSIFGWTMHSRWQFLLLAASFAATAYFVVRRLSTSPFGRVLRTIREDETFAQSLGKNVQFFKISAFAVSAALAGTAGSIYAHYVSFIDPTSFTAMESILILSMVIIGGASSPWGPLIGAVVLVSLPEVFRFIGLPNAIAANLRQILYGTLLVIIMIYRPQGLLGKYDFR
jgi:branched-chain amino acid transport system permease protein